MLPKPGMPNVMAIKDDRTTQTYLSLQVNAWDGRGVLQMMQHTSECELRCLVQGSCCTVPLLWR